MDFFEKKHHYPIHYVGNPTADEVREFLKAPPTPLREGAGGRLIALLAGSRKQEIKENLPSMLQAVSPFADRYQMVVAGAPGIAPEYYRQFTSGHQADIVFGQTYRLLSTAHAALVTSGTATLETALFRVPQVVCYKTPLPHFMGFLRRKLLHVDHISLVNLIAGREVVAELVADTFSVAGIQRELSLILDDGPRRQAMLRGYDEVDRRLGRQCAPEQAARLIRQLLSH